MNQIEAKLAELNFMTTGELATMYEKLYGHVCRSRHKAYLIRKVAWRLQADAMGGLAQRAHRRAMEIANDSDVRVMGPPTMICPPQIGLATQVEKTMLAAKRKPVDPRLPSPGSAIVRIYKGKKCRVLVCSDGQLEYAGEKYRTLTAVAKAITGTHVNGYRFFKLGVKR